MAKERFNLPIKEDRAHWGLYVRSPDQNRETPSIGACADLSPTSLADDHNVLRLRQELSLHFDFKELVGGGPAGIGPDGQFADWRNCRNLLPVGLRTALP